MDPVVDVSVDPSLLLERVQAGDRAAFSELYDALAPLVFGAVRRVLRDPAMSEEVTQEVFIEIWKTAHRFDSQRATAATWAATIARRRAVDRVRHEQSQRRRLDALAEQPAEPPPTAEAATITSLDAERVGRAMETLPDDQREVIQLAFMQGWAHGTIAAHLDLPLGTVKGRVRGGLKRLRGVIGDAP